MLISIFTNYGDSPSMRRYAMELAERLSLLDQVRVVSVEKKPGWRGNFFNRFILHPIKAAVSQGDINIIISEASAYLLLALKRNRSIVICHDLHPLMAPGIPSRSRRIYSASVRMMQAAQGIVAISESTRKDILTYLPKTQIEKIRVIPNGLSKQFRTMDDSGKAHGYLAKFLPPGARFVLHVGNDNWYKNFSVLLQALSFLSDKSVLLVKAGEIGPENKALCTSLSLSNRLIHIPDFTDDELITLYNSAEVFCFPSLHEGFGWPPLEAMACGCPVVLSKKASLPEVGGDACQYIDPTDPTEIAKALDIILADPMLRQRMSKEGKLRAAGFSWDRTASEIRSFAVSVLEGQKSEA